MPLEHPAPRHSLRFPQHARRDQSRQPSHRARLQELPPEHSRLQRAVGALLREVAMKRALSPALLFVLAWPLLAQTPPSGSAAAPTPSPGDFALFGKIDFGIQLVDLDTDSSKFR